MVKSISILLAFFFLTTGLYSQRFQEGYLKTVEGDSMPGLIGAMRLSLAYKRDKFAQRELIDVKEVQEFRIGSTRYKCMTVQVLKGHFPEFEHSCLEVVIEGPVELMEFRGDDIYGGEHVNYFVQYNSDPPMRVERKAKPFKRQMKSYFREYPELVTQLEAGEIGPEDLPKAVILFNLWHEQQAANPQ